MKFEWQGETIALFTTDTCSDHLYEIYWAVRIEKGNNNLIHFITELILSGVASISLAYWLSFIKV
ncbi:MAG: hypothetical protein H6Q35_1350 [Proteobacteria bacterium]|nr:hypothetical protein [Pseudomonadota bacterium]